MSTETIEMSLEGDVPLREFAAAVKHFFDLATALGHEVAEAADVQWTIDDLQAGSATIVARGASANAGAVARVAAAFGQVGIAIRDRAPIPYSERVGAAARGIVGILDGAVTAVRFHTAWVEAKIESPAEEQRQSRAAGALGVVQGTIETLAKRHALKFVLYDLLFDRPVYCYLQEGQEDLARDAWGRKAQVTGVVFRNPQSGYATSVRDITDVTVLRDTPRGAYKRARGALHAFYDGTPAELTIRSIRDAQ